MQTHKESEIKWVIFDLGGVLLNWVNAIEVLAKQLNTSYKEVKAFIDANSVELETGKLSTLKFWANLKKHFKSDLSVNHIAGTWIMELSRIDQGFNLVTKLSKKYKLALLTNNWHGVVNLEKKRFPKLFAKFIYIFDSCEIGMRKPDRGIYDYVQKAIGVKNGSEILFIDDLERNVATAKECGWQIRVFNPIPNPNKE